MRHRINSLEIDQLDILWEIVLMDYKTKYKTTGNNTDNLAYTQ